MGLSRYFFCLFWSADASEGKKWKFSLNSLDSLQYTKEKEQLFVAGKRKKC